jgi:hypothetical protein
LNPSTGRDTIVVVASSTINSPISLAGNTVFIQSSIETVKSTLNFGIEGCITCSSSSELASVISRLILSVSSVNSIVNLFHIFIYSFFFYDVFLFYLLYIDPVISCSGNLRILDVDVGGTSQAVTNIDVVLFEVVVGGRLEIIGLSLNYAEFESGVISIDDIFIMKDSLFDNIQLESTSLIWMTGGDVLIERCTFSDITLTSGNGSVINANIIAGDKLMIIGMSYYFFIFFIFFFILDTTFAACVISRSTFSGGGAIYIDQSGGSFWLIDSRESGEATFDSCGVSLSGGVGGALFLHNYGGDVWIGGSGLSFSGCFASNGTELFVNANNLESAIKERIFVDFDYNTSNDAVIGMSNNNLFSLTPIYLYDCFIKEKRIEKQGNSCPVVCGAVLCPESTTLGLYLFSYSLLMIFKFD